MKKHTNRLIHSSSPYLLQHAHNPVNWQPWDKEALQVAKTQDKPILLSIGYSSCHWCHVMEHESFENQEIAALMNENFVNIKIDREERPDLDAIYMNFVQMATGSGGWPLTVFLTPDQVPFYGGTYFPPEDHLGRPGFRSVLQNLAEAYRTQRQELEKNRNEILQRLQQTSRWDTNQGQLNENVFHDCHSSLHDQFDYQHGGFGSAPKFPSSMTLSFLLRFHRRTGNSDALNMVVLSLDRMADGGIYDHLGGGFHRYAVDTNWLTPHFEKMLYDNALLGKLYLEAYQVTGNPRYHEIVRETLQFVQREMMDPDGGFYSALDADSEGAEGKHYVWTPSQVEDVLGSNDATIFKEYFDITTTGNFEGTNILHPRMHLKDLAKSAGMSLEKLKQQLDLGRQRLLKVREKRVRPDLDNKCLAAWNGMMLTTFAEAAFVLDDKEFLNTALNNAEFLASKMMIDGRLLRSWRNGKAHLNAYLEDYALVTEGFLSVYQASGQIRWLKLADQLMNTQFALFWDPERGNFYFTSTDHETLLLRQKEHLDNAIPSGNSLSSLNLLRLSVLCGKEEYRKQAEGMLTQVAAVLPQHPTAFGCWLQSLDFFLGPVQEIALLAKQGETDLLQPVRKHFLPNKVVARAKKVDEPLAKLIPLLNNKTTHRGQPTLYVCQNYACQAPATDVVAVEKALEIRSTD